MAGEQPQTREEDTDDEEEGGGRRGRGRGGLTMISQLDLGNQLIGFVITVFFI